MAPIMRLGPLLLHALYCAAGHALLRQESSLDLDNWQWEEEADKESLLQVTIALAISHPDLGVDTLLRISDPASSDYGQHLSAREVARILKPATSALDNVVGWLSENAISANRVKLGYSGDRLSFNMSVQEGTTLLKTTFHSRIQRETGHKQVACKYYHIPAGLSGSIDYISAISTLSSHRRVPRHQIVLNDDLESNDVAPLPTHCLNQVTLPCLQKLYNIPNDVKPHANNSLGIFEPSWISWLPEDLDTFFSVFQKESIGRRPKVEGVNGGYLQRNYTGPNWNLEPNLDFEFAMAITSPQEVTNVQVGSYETVGNLDDMLAAFDEYYCDPVGPGDSDYPISYPPGCNSTACDCGSSKPPKVVSISWGYTEAAFTPHYLQRQCLEFLKLGLMGTTVVVSVSDHGTASGGGTYCIGNPTDGGCPDDKEVKFSPTYPSSCPWVTSVGGTQMLKYPTGLANGTNETVFRKNISGQTVSSGGGFSNVFVAPPYQVQDVASYKTIEQDHLEPIRKRFNSTGRGYPDVAARADDYYIASNGKWMPVSGTSASNPVFASIITLINSERMHAGKGSVGFINPVLYGYPDMLNDVVTGANQGCCVEEAFRACPGWDAVTGLGSPDYKRMREVFLNLP